MSPRRHRVSGSVFAQFSGPTIEEDCFQVERGRMVETLHTTKGVQFSGKHFPRALVHCRVPTVCTPPHDFYSLLIESSKSYLLLARPQSIKKFPGL